ncbi:MAG: GIDE domain-containing protein [Halobacteria archaeon]|nr:GIDE domain-containing protein [Halobacteria archaeon]
MPFVFSMVFFLVGILAIRQGFLEYKKKNLMRNTPTSKIRSAPMGEVEIKGSVVPKDETLTSPFSNEEAVMYEYEVEEYDPDDDGGNWDTIDSGKKHVLFYVDDGTGKALVRPEGADFKLPKDNRFKVDGGTEPPQAIREFIEESKNVDSENTKIDLKITELSTGRDRRYTEYYIETDQDVYVFGNATNEDTEENADVSEEFDVVVKDFNDRASFMISDLSEEDLVSRTGKNYRIILIIGVILTIMGFGMILAFGI